MDNNNLNDYKDCPYCGEKIRMAAIKCRYCHTSLTDNNRPELSQADANGLTKKSDSKGTIAITLAIVSLLLIWVPYFAAILGAIGAFFGYKGFKTNRRTLSIIATAICAMVLIINIAFSIAVTSSTNKDHGNTTTDQSPSSSSVSSNSGGQTTKQESTQSGLVTVESVKIIEQSQDHKILYPDMIEVVIKNNHTETIRNYSVGLIGFDQNGFPLKIEWNIDFSGGDYVRFGSAEDANVMPGDTAGRDSGWGLDESHGIRYILAEIYDVEFYDSKLWENPNFDNWANEFAEKPLPEHYRK